MGRGPGDRPVNQCERLILSGLVELQLSCNSYDREVTSHSAKGRQQNMFKRIDEQMINNMPGGYILDKMNNQNGTSFRHDNVIFRSK